MLIVNIVASLILLLGPIVGYRASAGGTPKRWHVIAWSAVGGAASGVLLFGVMFLSELWDATARELLRTAIRVAGEFALFGLVFGFVGVLLRAHSWRRPSTIGVVMLGLMSAIRLVIIAVSGRPADEGASGVVFGPDSVPAAGAFVFLDRGGSNPLERLTTDSTGLFRAPLKPWGYRKAMLLICVPGGIPTIARPVEKSLTPARFQIFPLAPRANVEVGLRPQGWRKATPGVCRAYLA